MRVLERFCSNLSFPGLFETAFATWKSCRGKGFYSKRESNWEKKNEEYKEGDREKRAWFKKNNKQLS
jgi:hypothetical protein